MSDVCLGTLHITEAAKIVGSQCHSVKQKRKDLNSETKIKKQRETFQGYLHDKQLQKLQLLVGLLKHRNEKRGNS